MRKLKFLQLSSHICKIQAVKKCIFRKVVFVEHNKDSPKNTTMPCERVSSAIQVSDSVKKQLAGGDSMFSRKLFYPQLHRICVIGDRESKRRSLLT